MSELHRHKIRLSPRQKNKLRLAYKKRRNTVIGLKRDDIGSGEHILLTERQHKAVNKALKHNTGLRLILGFDQLMKNKEGGLLKEMLSFVEENVPGGKRFISPLVRHQIAPILKDHFLPWLKQLIDHELDTIIVKDKQGDGLKECINKKLDELIAKANSKGIKN